MRRFKFPLNLFITLFAVFLTSTVNAECAEDEPGRRIAQSFNERWTKVVRQGDRNAVESLYSAQALLMPPTDDTLFGASSITDYLLEHVGADELAGYSIDLLSCERRGDTLHVAGVWGSREIDDNGRSSYIGGNVVRVLTRQPDGVWASSHDIWN